MSLWSRVSCLPPEQLASAYGEFPRSLRNLLADWLESQPWEFVTGVDAAGTLLAALLERLQALAGGGGPQAQLLQHIASLEGTYRHDPLRLLGIVRRVLQEEKAAVMKQDRHLPLGFHRQQEEMKFGLELQRLQHRVRELQARRQARPGLQGSQPKTEATGTGSELPALLLEAMKELEGAKQQVLKRIQIWKRHQQLAGNGATFDESLDPLQKRCEGLVDVLFQLQQEAMAAGAELGAEALARLLERLNDVLTSLVKSSFVVEKQPPQVLKTQTKFQAGVRLLLGPRLLAAAPRPCTVHADVVTEKQARDLAQGSSTLSESTGEILHNVVSLETNLGAGSCCAVFKNALLKKIKRCERKGSESVTEEKCAVLFSVTVSLSPGNLTLPLQVLSLPIVVIVHGNQDNNAKATVLWDNAFAEPDRVPFVVAERVPWERMCETLNLKFMSEVQTTRGLQPEHFFFLAQKIFNDHSAGPEAFTGRPVSWAQFNKEILPGRGFTFWQWFDGVLDLTKRCLKSYWSDRLIRGFISKQYVSRLLSTAPDGTFLLRYSDSEIGGVTIAYLARAEDGSWQVENIQPFSAKDLSIRSLGDRIRDLVQLRNLYPNIPKDQAFGNHYNKEQMAKDGRGYVPTTIKMTVESERVLQLQQPGPMGVPPVPWHPNEPLPSNICLQGLDPSTPMTCYSHTEMTPPHYHNPSQMVSVAMTTVSRVPSCPDAFSNAPDTRLHLPFLLSTESTEQLDTEMLDLDPGTFTGVSPALDTSFMPPPSPQWMGEDGLEHLDQLLQEGQHEDPTPHLPGSHSIFPGLDTVANRSW